jgi:hypothetical protein
MASVGKGPDCGQLLFHDNGALSFEKVGDGGGLRRLEHPSLEGFCGA